MDAQAVEHILAGPPRHGVVRFGRHLYEALGTGAARVADSVADLPAVTSQAAVHVSFTDHLFGPDPQSAVDAVLGLAAGRLLSVTLHDIPQPGEGTDRCARRMAAYRRLIAAAEVVVTNSVAEAERLGRHGGAVDVVPLPIEHPRPRAAAPGPSAQLAAGPSAQPAAGGAPTIGIFGFVYPGKGCEAVITAAPPGSRIVLLGSVAAGHADYLAQLQAQARARGLELQCTGYLPESELAAHLDAVTVPVCAHRHVSASGSLHTWIAHNRVPIVLTSEYMAEIGRRWPAHVRLCTTAELPDVLRAALTDPGSTWADSEPPAWGWDEVAAAYRQIWERI